MPAVLTLPRIQPMNLLPCFLASAARQRRPPTQRAAGCDLLGGYCLVLRVRPPHHSTTCSRSLRQELPTGLWAQPLICRSLGGLPAGEACADTALKGQISTVHGMGIVRYLHRPWDNRLCTRGVFFIVLRAESIGASCIECGKPLLRVFGGPASETGTREILSVEVVGNWSGGRPSTNRLSSRVAARETARG